MKITGVKCVHQNEPFITPFSFKGNALTSAWISEVIIFSENQMGIGVSIQSVLWSDSNIFVKYGEKRSNELMYEVTKYALGLLMDEDFENPRQIMGGLSEKCHSYIEKLMGISVSKTFVLNALVPVDMALWQLWARVNKIKNFDFVFKGQNKCSRIVNVPLVTYKTSVDEVISLAEKGVCLFKIKLGADPDGDNDYEKMLAWDKKRILEIHNALKNYTTSYTENGRIAYYFDANGRYPDLETLKNLVNFMEENHIKERTVLFEEPFSPDSTLSVKDIDINFAADESVHDIKDVYERAKSGYKTLTLKPIAKTFSITIDMVEAALENGMQCFCADLTVPPITFLWNKCFASRLNFIKGMKIGIIESNGAQNYVNWDKMLSYIGKYDETDAFYILENDFYENSDGIFEVCDFYKELIMKSQPDFTKGIVQ